MPLLIGPLADPALRLRLAPAAVHANPVPGRLRGGALAGIAPDGFPTLIAGPGQVPAYETAWTPELRRYAAIFGLEGDLLGAGHDADDRPWQPDLARAVADWVLALPSDHTAEHIRHRLPMMAGWVASRQRAAAEGSGLPHLGPQGDGRWHLMSRNEPYANYFSVEALQLRHRRHRGDMSPQMQRAVFVSGDATVVLPWDPVRDRVMLIDQFRAGPAARGDAQPWFYETIAGRIDAGETPKDAALREAIEEAGLHITNLIPGPNNYPSSGAVAEYLYLFVGIADLPDSAAGFGGMDAEDEDIRSHLIARSELTRMALDGTIRNGPLLTLAMWLELSAGRILAELDPVVTV